MQTGGDLQKGTSGSAAEEMKNANPNLAKKHRDGKLQTVRYELVSASLLAEFLKQRRKVEEQEATIAKLQKQGDAVNAGLQKVRTQLEGSKSEPRVVIKAAQSKRQQCANSRYALIERRSWLLLTC